jgi:signal transduction histidine kinase
LISALRELAASTEKLFNIQCRFANDGAVSIPDQEAATHLYRIAQEAVTNAIEHGKASTVEISLTKMNDQTLLAVDDNGIFAGVGSPPAGWRVP